MTLPPPTELYRGVAEAAPQDASHTIAWFAVLLPAIVVFLWQVSRRRQHARMYPDEHAFRALAKRLRLRANEVRAVRDYANSVARIPPIVVLMNDQMCQEALEMAKRSA